ncbi:MAG: 1-acyl-sn-glycerol-3-phosphate acyltransferase [Candidatus Cryptobacteroides sp.]
MRKVWENDRWYNILRYWVDFTTRTSFSHLEISGRENLPTDGSIMYAPNHCAALMDPLMILLIKHGSVAFAARFDIFRNPKIGSMLRWLRILPIARERDGLREVAGNYEVFRQIVECMDKEVPFCIFSEGTHCAQRGLLPVKKGIFRISKMALDMNGKKVYIVPVGIDYEYFFREGGRAAIRIGKSLELGEYFAARAGSSKNDIYRSLCTDLREELLSLIGRIPPRRHDRIVPRFLLSLISLPLFAACIVPAAPIWLPEVLIVSRLEDKAWSHTVSFVLRLLLPLFLPFYLVFNRLLNLYRNLLCDLFRRDSGDC